MFRLIVRKSDGFDQSRQVDLNKKNINIILWNKVNRPFISDFPFIFFLSVWNNKKSRKLKYS